MKIADAILRLEGPVNNMGCALDLVAASGGDAELCLPPIAWAWPKICIAWRHVAPDSCLTAWIFSNSASFSCAVALPFVFGVSSSCGLDVHSVASPGCPYTWDFAFRKWPRAMRELVPWRIELRTDGEWSGDVSESLEQLRSDPTSSSSIYMGPRTLDVWSAP